MHRKSTYPQNMRRFLIVLAVLGSTHCSVDSVDWDNTESAQTEVASEDYFVFDRDSPCPEYAPLSSSEYADKLLRGHVDARVTDSYARRVRRAANALQSLIFDNLDAVDLTAFKHALRVAHCNYYERDDMSFLASDPDAPDDMLLKRGYSESPGLGLHSIDMVTSLGKKGQPYERTLPMWNDLENLVLTSGEFSDKMLGKSLSVDPTIPIQTNLDLDHSFHEAGSAPGRSLHPFHDATFLNYEDIHRIKGVEAEKLEGIQFLAQEMEHPFMVTNTVFWSAHASIHDQAFSVVLELVRQGIDAQVPRGPFNDRTKNALKRINRRREEIRSKNARRPVRMPSTWEQQIKRIDKRSRIALQRQLPAYQKLNQELHELLGIDYSLAEITLANIAYTGSHVWPFGRQPGNWGIWHIFMALARKHLYQNVLDLVTTERDQSSLDQLMQFGAFEPSEAITLYRLWESGLLFRSINYGFSGAAFTSRNRADGRGFGLEARE